MGVELESTSIPEITMARNLKERSCEAFPTPLSSHFGHSPFAPHLLRGRTDAPLKVGRLAFTYPPLRARPCLSQPPWQTVLAAI